MTEIEKLETLLEAADAEAALVRVPGLEAEHGE